MSRPELKLKQASVVADMPPKELQNLVQFKVVRPTRRGRAFWFDRDTLLQATCAYYLKQTLGASTAYLIRFVQALTSRTDLASERASVRIESSPRAWFLRRCSGPLPGMLFIAAGVSLLWSVQLQLRSD